jgi:DNA-binding response OmpR family regulator
MTAADEAASAPATKILVIDDDGLIRMACNSVLKKGGYQVLLAENGNDGVNAFKKESPALVITDILMPDKEGLETISDLRKINASVKIIAMSGGGSTHNMSFLQLARKIGAQAILIKPFKPDELLSIVQETLSAP